MSIMNDIKNILLQYLPDEICRKIIYECHGFQTPSCRVMKNFLHVVKEKFSKFDEITSIKLRVLKPKKLFFVDNYEEWEQYYDVDDNINKMIVITYEIPNISFQKIFRRRVYLFT